MELIFYSSHEESFAQGGRYRISSEVARRPERLLIPVRRFRRGSQDVAKKRADQVGFLDPVITSHESRTIRGILLCEDLIQYIEWLRKRRIGIRAAT